MSRTPQLPGVDPVVGSTVERVGILEALTPPTFSLTVDDGVTTVTDVDRIFASPGLVVTDLGGGDAEVGVARAAEYFAGSASLNLGAGGSSAFSLAHGGGNTILSYTSPTAPTVIKSGYYAVTCEISSGAVAFPDYMDLSLAVQTSFGITMFAEGRGIAPAASTPYMRLTLAGVWPMTAGQALSITLLSQTALVTNFVLNNSAIVKLS